MSPSTTTPTSTTASPRFNNISLPPNIYNTPYTNGHTTPSPSTPSINLPNNLPNQPQNPPQSHAQNYSPNNAHNQPSLNQPPPPPSNNQNSNIHPPNQFQNNYNNMPPNGAGMMGPPSKPAEKDNANDDQMDVLANAGVDLRAEESYAMSFHTGSFNSQPSFSQPGSNGTGHAFTQFAAGDTSSFYGAGPASQDGQPTDKATQDALHKKVADEAWARAASDLARSREHELKRPHVNVGAVWKRMDIIAKDNGLSLNVSEQGQMPQLKLPNEFRSNVTVKTVPGPQGSMVVTGGGFLPADTALADQLALLSLATNQRLRILLEDAVAIAKGRRSGSQGVVPVDWTDAASPVSMTNVTIVADGAPRSGWESAVSPHTQPLKRKSTIIL
jgi:hypothetical protein